MALFQPTGTLPPNGSTASTPPLPHIPILPPPNNPNFQNPTSMLVVLAIVGAWPLALWSTIRLEQSASIAGTVLVPTPGVVPYQPYYVIGPP